LKQTPAAVQPTLHRAERNAGYVGDLPVIQSLHVAQDHDLTELPRQSLDLARDLLIDERAEKATLRVICGEAAEDALSRYRRQVVAQLAFRRFARAGLTFTRSQ